MRTEQDLRAALTERENLAPPPDTVLADVRHIADVRQVAVLRRRRMTGTAAAVILAVAAAAAVPVLLLRGSPADPGPAPVTNAPVGAATPSLTAAPVDPGAPRPPYSFTIRSGPVAGFDIVPNSVSPDAQIAQIRPVGVGQPLATLFVYRPGTNVRIGGDASGWDVITALEVNADVNGAPAWYTTTAEASSLRWEYAPDGFAVIGSNQGRGAIAKEPLVMLAEAVRFVAPYPAKVPYRLDFFPKDLTEFHIGQNTGPTDFSRSDVLALSSDEDPRSMDITIFEGQPRANSLWFGYPDWDWKPGTIAGRAARCADLVDGRRCEIDFGEFTLSMGVTDLTPDELDRLVAGMRFATVGDPTTWYDIDVAIPGL